MRRYSGEGIRGLRPCDMGDSPYTEDSVTECQVSEATYKLGHRRHLVFSYLVGSEKRNRGRILKSYIHYIYLPGRLNCHEDLLDSAYSEAELHWNAQSNLVDAKAKNNLLFLFLELSLKSHHQGARKYKYSVFTKSLIYEFPLPPWIHKALPS